MKEEMTLSELLFRIKLEKDRLESYNNILNPKEDTDGLTTISPNNKNTIFFGISRNNSNELLTGENINDFKNKTRLLYEHIANNLATFIKLMKIKEEVNSSIDIYIESPFTGEKKWYSIPELLILKSSYFKKYYIDFLKKLELDYNTVFENERQLSLKANDKDSIDRYVLARLNSLNIPFEKGYYENYEKFSKEYISANKYNLIDSIGIDSILKQKEYLMNFYNKIDDKLFEANKTIKFWIDLSSNDLWGINQDINNKEIRIRSKSINDD